MLHHLAPGAGAEQPDFGLMSAEGVEYHLTQFFKRLLARSVHGGHLNGPRA
jgi:hypothetical protein